jgi:hypothetical protein
MSIAFNRNGDRLISAGSLGKIKVWDAPRGNRTAPGN